MMSSIQPVDCINVNEMVAKSMSTGTEEWRHLRNRVNKKYKDKKLSLMKKSFLSMAASTLVSLREQTIVMKKDGSVYKIPCLVNGAKMKFIFDTGASTVSLSLPMAEYLYDNDYISSADFIKAGQSVIADGSVVDHMEINIRDIEISGLHLFNVPAIVIATQNAPLLLGMSAIQKLGKIEIDGNVLRINGGDNPDIDSRVDELLDRILSYQKNKFYSREQKCWEEVATLTELSDRGLFEYAECCYFNDDDATALRILEKINNYDNITDIDGYVYDIIGSVYYNNDKYDEAIVYYKKSLEKYQDENDLSGMGWSMFGLAMVYEYGKENHKEASIYYSKASSTLYLSESNIHNNDAYHNRDKNGQLKNGEKSYRTDIIDSCDFNALYCAYIANILPWKDFFKALFGLIDGGNTYAEEYFKFNHLDQ